MEMLTLNCRVNSSTAKASPGAHPAGPAPGWKTKKHKRYISKDSDLLGQLEVACQGDDRTSTIKSSVSTVGACSLTHIPRIRRISHSSRTFLFSHDSIDYASSKIP